MNIGILSAEAERGSKTAVMSDCAKNEMRRSTSPLGTKNSPTETLVALRDEESRRAEAAAPVLSNVNLAAEQLLDVLIEKRCSWYIDIMIAFQI